MIIHVPFKDLAPNIVRRRLVIEGITKSAIPKERINTYMIELSTIMDMTIVSNPVFNYDEDYGNSAYMCWKESGMHVYTWSKSESRPDFFSIDIYTCKDFEIKDVINFTSKTFENILTELTWRE
jgi:S-adenosylmethionine/arginine decarboxylase-like enzyme